MTQQILTPVRRLQTSLLKTIPKNARKFYVNKRKPHGPFSLRVSCPECGCLHRESPTFLIICECGSYLYREERVYMYLWSSDTEQESFLRVVGGRRKLRRFKKSRNKKPL